MSKFKIGNSVAVYSLAGVLVVNEIVHGINDTATGPSYDIFPLNGGPLHSIPENRVKRK